MKYTINHIAAVLKATAQLRSDTGIEHLLIDSRKIVFPSTSLFFALQGPRRDGHQFIPELYERGIRNFVVQKRYDAVLFTDANYLFVDDVLQSLQALAAYHRNQFNYPVIAITGSNGKTIVKEWLNQLLQEDLHIVRSPRSYNSQVGVPLSVWQMNDKHSIGIFEAGISTIDEMKNLEKILQPTIGVFTNIGEAHNEGFKNINSKIEEKSVLFTHAKAVIFPQDNTQITSALTSKGTDQQLFGWGRNNSPALKIVTAIRSKDSTVITVQYHSEEINISIPFTDEASIENAMSCLAVLLYLKVPIPVIQKRMLQLQPVEMRMESGKGINNCSILNDSYSNDLSSLGIALDHLKQQAGDHMTTVILSDIIQSGMKGYVLYTKVANELKQRNIHRLIGIGGEISSHASLFRTAIEQEEFYPSTEIFLQQAHSNRFSNEFILLKGARIFAFERISKWLEQKLHQTVMEINLSAIAHNLKEYQKHVLPETKLMAMVKAFSYGSGSAEVARVLQFHKVDYLAVAYADEGIDLRKAGISLPLLVMNADETTFDALIENGLEPEIYSFNIYHAFHQYLLQQGITKFAVHIKIDTGMNRLGFTKDETNELGELLKKNSTMVVKSVFSHLAASESAAHDDFTKMQAALFDEACSIIKTKTGHPFCKHLSNSAAIFRHPHLQYDMVRLGIGLYGVDSANGKQLSLETVATLKSTIAQIRKVKAGDTVGYSRKGKVDRDSLIAIVRIGYADGFSRKFSNGVGKMYVNGQTAPVIGNVCMDMTMIDITDIAQCKEGDEVEIFGKHLQVEQLAEWTDTIAYEIMTTISQRVKRVYLEE